MAGAAEGSGPRDSRSRTAADEIDNIIKLTETSTQDVCRALLHDYVTAVRPDWDAAELFR